MNVALAFAVGALTLGVEPDRHNGDQETLPKEFTIVRADADESVTCSAAKSARTPNQEMLAINGHVTEAHWPGKAPRAYKMAQGQYLIDAGGSGRLYLWSVMQKRLEAFPGARLERVRGYGQVIVRHGRNGAREICNLDLDTGQLHSFWGRLPSDRRQTLATEILGVSQRRLVLGGRESGKQGATLVILEPGHAVVEHELTEDIVWATADRDCVRGDRALAYRQTTAPRLDSEKNSEDRNPFNAEAFIVDIPTGKVHRLGEVRGYWIGWIGGYEHWGKYVPLGWATRGQLQELQGKANSAEDGSDRQSGQVCLMSYVVEDTLEIIKVETPVNQVIIPDGYSQILSDKR